MKVYTVREFIIVLKNNGYIYDRSSGDHDIYIKGNKHISIPQNRKTLHPGMSKRFIKEYGLKIN